ncbi:MAG: [FeFe] hydrogenase H-cluster radical SAM maturase HydE, partial [Eubacteriales bacterium]
KNRLQCLYELKFLGFQTGCGFMVGSPWQTSDTIASDLELIYDLKPQMARIGPFLPHHDTPFRSMPPGDLRLTLYLLSIIRIMSPQVLLPATTALGTLQKGGRELGILHGANVVMPNLSPVSVRQKYMLYDNKLSSGTEAAEGLLQLQNNFAAIGYEISFTRGDSPMK